MNRTEKGQKMTSQKNIRKHLIFDHQSTMLPTIARQATFSSYTKMGAQPNDMHQAS
jgi:hypothetical protein